MRPWYRSCPHACSDPEACPYGRNHLPKIRALLQKRRELEDELTVLKVVLAAHEKREHDRSASKKGEV